MESLGAPVTAVTDRERDVLALVAGHLTNAEIAGRLTLSVRTVESHVSSLIRKLEVRDRRGLARRAEELGLLQPRRPRPWPSPADPFVGRHAEVAALDLHMRDHRVVTVSGPGGVGKTRLTTHAVHQVAHQRPDGAWFVDLSQVATPDGAVPAIAAVVGAVEGPGHPLVDALTATLAGADGVLVLDNCEHLLPGVEAHVARLVESCPRLTVVATSRAPLRAPYEWVYELPGLTIDDAVHLFRTRAEAAGGVVPDDPRVRDLCARLEGVALAIELAAARYPLLGLDGLVTALADPLRLLGSGDGARQRSLRATIRWSVDLLDHEARRMFVALFAFAGPFTLAAAHAVAWPDRGLADAARVLATLADQHLLRVVPGDPTRYDFQEVVRQFAAVLAEDEGAAADVTRRHAQWAADELGSLAGSPRDDAWCARFDELSTEVRAVLARPVECGDLGERYAEELVQRGRLEEAQRRFEALAAGAHGDERVHLLRQAAGAAAARLVGDDVMRLLDEVADAALSLGDRTTAADALGWSVIFAAFHPGIMATRPSQEEIDRRLADARSLVDQGTAAGPTVAAAGAMCLPGDQPGVAAASRRAADAAIAADLPLVASAALDCLCVSELSREEYGAALAAVTERGTLMDGQTLTAATAYPFNDYLLMGCEVSLAAGDLLGARRYAERLTGLPCYRDYVHPALARFAEVDVLTGDLDDAVRHGERFLDSWERAGRHRASTLAVGAYAVALAHGLLGDDAGLASWRAITERLLDQSLPAGDTPELAWAATFDAWLLLHRGSPDDALDRLRVAPDDPAWSASGNSLMWKPWYVAAWAEARALTDGPHPDRWLGPAVAATRQNPVAAALVARAEALARGDLEEVAASARTLDGLAAGYQRDRSLRLGHA
ncbi:MAG TPA: LuxR C-terminal-related transcriptional regulator [Nocardioides sp.]|nr:LuxR C-terminal-related transcriptional regulator [Nocardioides sp.]